MQVKLNVYQVEQCGYYSHGGHVPAFGSVQDTLSSIHDWVHKKHPTVPSTRTFNADEDGEQLPVYCFDIAGKVGGDWLLTTWNETPSEDGVVGAVASTSKAGDGEVVTGTLPAESIVGYGTHFWFLPTKGRVVTVRFASQPLNGHVGLNHYLRGYLERFSPNVRFKKDKMKKDVLMREVIGYAKDTESKEADDSFHPRFRSTVLRRDAEIAYIRDNYKKIKKVIRKGRPSGGDAATQSLLDKALVFVGAPQKQRALPDIGYTFEIPYRPSKTELNAIIKQWESEDNEKWDDVGFDFKGDKEQRRWLSQSTLKVDADLPNTLRDGAGSVAPADKLLEALKPYRKSVTA